MLLRWSTGHFNFSTPNYPARRWNQSWRKCSQENFAHHSVDTAVLDESAVKLNAPSGLNSLKTRNARIMRSKLRGPGKGTSKTSRMPDRTCEFCPGTRLASEQADFQADAGHDGPKLCQQPGFTKHAYRHHHHIEHIPESKALAKSCPEFVQRPRTGIFS